MVVNPKGVINDHDNADLVDHLAIMVARQKKHTEAKIIESVSTAIEHIIGMPILDRHRRDLIRSLLWQVTEARGKYTTRYRSRAAFDDPKQRIQHDHVFTRQDLCERLMKPDSNVRSVLKDAVACVVTVDEHTRLTSVTRANPSLKGWDRYEAAGIEVVDVDRLDD